MVGNTGLNRLWTGEILFSNCFPNGFLCVPRAKVESKRVTIITSLRLGESLAPSSTRNCNIGH